jgi:hypothetical protein
MPPLYGNMISDVMYAFTLVQSHSSVHGELDPTSCYCHLSNDRIFSQRQRLRQRGRIDETPTTRNMCRKHTRTGRGAGQSLFGRRHHREMRHFEDLRASTTEPGIRADFRAYGDVVAGSTSRVTADLLLQSACCQIDSHPRYNFWERANNVM